MEKSRKIILLVDDDPVFLKGMMYTVKQLGYDPVLAQGGKEAVEVLKKQKVHGIISDINMPEGNGLQLLNFVRKRSTIPFILMTGLSDLKEAKAAMDMGASFFLSKPFKKSELGGILQLCFEDQQEKVEAIPEAREAMVKLHIEDFLHGEDISCDIYMKQDERFIKVSAGGERLSADVVASYRSAEIYSLYIKRSDFVEHIGLKSFCLKPASLETKRQLKEAFENELAVLNDIYALNAEAVSRAHSLFYSVLDVLCDNADTFDLLEKLQTERGMTFKMATHSALMAAQVSQYTGRRSIREFFSLVTAALFSGVGVIGTSLHSKDYSEFMTEDEKVILEAHPVRSSKMIAKLPLPAEIALIISQHEEKEDGSGYPHNLKGHQIHPLAKIVSATHSFVFEHLQENFISAEDSVQKLEAFTVKSVNFYDIQVLEAMLQAFNLSTPQEFVEYQLNRILTAGESA